MIQFSVIGIGRMGGIHAANLYAGRVKGAKLSAVCDTDTAKLDAFAANHPGIKCYATLKDLIAAKPSDAVIIATPHYSHPDIVIQCLKAGFHTLTEKPEAVTVGEAARMNAEAVKHPELKYGIMFNQRTNKLYRKAKELVNAGELGEIRRANFIVTDWYRSQAYYDQGGWRASWAGEGGGVLINQCVHQLDVLQWILGMPLAIFAECVTRNRKITVENEVTAVFNYAGGTKAVFTGATNELKGVNRLEIAGTRGRIVITPMLMKYNKFVKSEPEVNEITVKGYGSAKSRVKYFSYGLLNKLRDTVLGQQLNIIKNFAKVLEGKAELIAPGAEGINSLSLINGIYMSDALRTEVKLPLVSSDYDRLLSEKVKKEKNK